MKPTELERGVQQLAASLDREIEDLRRKIVDRVVRIAEDAQQMLARVKTEGAEGATTTWIASHLADLEKAKAELADREAQRGRVEELVRFARKSAS